MIYLLFSTEYGSRQKINKIIVNNLHICAQCPKTDYKKRNANKSMQQTGFSFRNITKNRLLSFYVKKFRALYIQGGDFGCGKGWTPVTFYFYNLAFFVLKNNL